MNPEQVQAGPGLHRAFVSARFTGAQRGRGGLGMDLKAAMAHTRKIMDPDFARSSSTTLPALRRDTGHDEASGIRDPRIWTAARDQEMWHALQA